MDSPEDIVKYYKAGTLGSFSTKLFELFMLADSMNKIKLASVFPEYYKAYMIWYKGE